MGQDVLVRQYSIHCLDISFFGYTWLPTMRLFIVFCYGTFPLILNFEADILSHFLMGGSEKVISYWSNTNKIKMLGCAFNSAQSVRAHSTHTFYHTEWVRSKRILSELYKFINYALHSESLSLSNFVVYPKYCFFLCNLLERKQGDKKTMRKSEYWEWQGKNNLKLKISRFGDKKRCWFSPRILKRFPLYS